MSSFFQKYGEIESTNIRCENNVLVCGLIQYKDCKVANYLVEQGKISLYDVEYEIKPMNEFRDDQHRNVKIIERIGKLSLVEVKKFGKLTQNTQNNIFTVLNDDCLHQIFKKIDQMSDFHSIANVCIKFNRISKEAFSSKLRQTTVSFTDLMHDRSDVTLSEIDRFLTNFGSSIFCASTLCGSFLFEDIPDISEILLKLIYKHCPNLMELHVSAVNITKRTLLDICLLLSQLKCLQINLTPESVFGPFNDCLVHCTQLETLNINGFNRIQYTLPAITFSKLINFEKTVDDISCDEFLTHNPQIERLNINYSPKLCEIISNKLSNIQSLILHVGVYVFTEIDNIHLRHLKYLDLNLFLNINDNSIRNLYIFPMKNITQLWLYTPGIFDQNLLIELTKNVHALKNLTIQSIDYENLEPTNQITMAVLKEMLQYGKQLSELTIYCSDNYIFYFAAKDYHEVLEIIKNRANNIKLNINIECKITKMVYMKFNPSHSIERFKYINLNMFPKWLTISVNYSYDQWGN